MMRGNSHARPLQPSLSRVRWWRSENGVRFAFALAEIIPHMKLLSHIVNGFWMTWGGYFNMAPLTSQESEKDATTCWWEIKKKLTAVNIISTEWGNWIGFFFWHFKWIGWVWSINIYFQRFHRDLFHITYRDLSLPSKQHIHNEFSTNIKRGSCFISLSTLCTALLPYLSSCTSICVSSCLSVCLLACVRQFWM